eukprot:gene8664-11707_t
MSLAKNEFETNLTPVLRELSRGYPLEMFHAYTDRNIDQLTLLNKFQCNICHEVINGAVLCNNSKIPHGFCIYCLNKHYETKNRNSNSRNCPVCTLTASHDELVSNPYLDNLIIDYKIYCYTKYVDQQQHENVNCCSWTGKLLDLRSHLLTECDQSIFDCGFPNCNFSGTRIAVKHHMRECELKLIRCEYCADILLESSLLSHHSSVCMQIPMKCSKHPQCEEMVTRFTMAKHLDQECLYQSIACSLCCAGFCKDLHCSGIVQRITNNRNLQNPIFLENIALYAHDLNRIVDDSNKKIEKLTNELSMEKEKHATMMMQFRREFSDYKKEMNEKIHTIAKIVLDRAIPQDSMEDMTVPGDGNNHNYNNDEGIQNDQLKNYMICGFHSSSTAAVFVDDNNTSQQPKSNRKKRKQSNIDSLEIANEQDINAIKYDVLHIGDKDCLSIDFGGPFEHNNNQYLIKTKKIISKNITNENDFDTLSFDTFRAIIITSPPKISKSQILGEKLANYVYKKEGGIVIIGGECQLKQHIVKIFGDLFVRLLPIQPGSIDSKLNFNNPCAIEDGPLLDGVDSLEPGCRIYESSKSYKAISCLMSEYCPEQIVKLVHNCKEGANIEYPIVAVRIVPGITSTQFKPGMILSIARDFRLEELKSNKESDKSNLLRIIRNAILFNPPNVLNGAAFEGTDFVAEENVN